MRASVAIFLTSAAMASCSPLSMPNECQKGGCRLTAKGWWPSECVHNVPNGASVRALPQGQGVEVIYPNGTKEVMPECPAEIPQESLARFHREPGGLNSSAPETQQFGSYPIIWEFGIDPKNAPMNSWSAAYRVGDPPKTGPGGSFWAGLEPYTCDSVMQAVTYFTNSGWFVVSENCCPGGRDFRVGDVKVEQSEIIHGSVTRITQAKVEAATCTPDASVKTGICNHGNTNKAPGSDKGALTPADCAKICETDVFKSTLGSCLGWSVVPSSVPSGLRQYQGCYISNASWDGTRSACPYGADSSGCSSRGVAKYAGRCCGASGTGYIINTTVNDKTYTLNADNGKDMNVPLVVLELYSGLDKCSDLPSSVRATNILGNPKTFYGKTKTTAMDKCNWKISVTDNNSSVDASSPTPRDAAIIV